MGTSGNKLKMLREKNKMTQKELATLLYKAESTISMWERGDREMDQDTLVNVSKIFNVSIDYLLGVTENPNRDINEADEDLSFKFALYGEVKDLTEEQKQTILDMARFLKDSNKK